MPAWEGGASALVCLVVPFLVLMLKSPLKSGIVNLVARGLVLRPLLGCGTFDLVAVVVLHGMGAESGAAVVRCVAAGADLIYGERMFWDWF